MGIDDPFSAAADDDEAERREIMADTIAAKYEQDSDNGRPIITNAADAFIVRTLMSKAPSKPAHTIDDAIKLYKRERIKGGELEVKKNTQRMDRAIKRMKEALGGTVPPLLKFSREDARKVRDHLLGLDTLTPASVKRELNIIKAVFNLAITEFELSCNNPFNKLDIPGLDEDGEDEFEKRFPFPPDLLDKARAMVMSKSNHELRLIWRLLEGTGARLAEITGLRVEDLTLTAPTPNIRVTWHQERRVKTKASKRFIPLVGDALKAAQEAVQAAEGKAMLFAQYGNENGPTNASQSLMKRVREATSDERLVVHSLRHNMKDRLVLAEVDELTQNLILGHRLKGTGSRVYGGSPARLQATTAGIRRAFGLTGSQSFGSGAPHQAE